VKRGLLWRPPSAAYVALLDAIGQLDGLVPCRLEPDLWTSEDAEERAEAALRCQPCPVLAECHRAATARPRVTFGVWGGRDRTPCGRRAGR